MIAADRVLPVVATAIGGFVAGYSIRESLGQDVFHIESTGKWYGAFVTAQWAGSITVLMAVLVLVAVHRRRPRISAAVATVLGSLLVALPSFVPIAANQAVTTNALGAGALVGICGFIAGGRRLPSGGLAGGLLGSMLFYSAISRLRGPREGRWMDGLGPYLVESTVPLLLLLATTVVLLVAVRRASVGRLETSDAVAALVLGFVCLVVYIYLGNTTSTAATWMFAVAIVVLVAYGVAFDLGGRDGRYMISGLAIAASGVNALGWGDASWWIFVVAAVLFVGAVGVGLRRDLTPAACGLLAVVTAAGLLPIGDDSINVVGAVFYCVLHPIAVGLLLGSARATRTVASTIGPLVPFALTLFSVSAPVPPRVFGWVDGTSDVYVPPIVWLNSPLPVGVVVAVIVILVCLVLGSRVERDHHDRVSDSSGP
ncbi:hypothetical protein HQP42_03340 [Rhodococcus fascians]|nr:hypothetical protein [Rhodococcus fascians]MBY3824110.1 hypothetical protein [Rhodococcus fascians]MBY3834632.1 hypothetical protein [Rhodococcus fascians]MBY3863844.1 hypothetical protein [Rhodococcus fascians]MBY3883315.1 hypothetical protein [Rhodococcus fascians]